MESCNFFVTIFLIFIYIGAITAEVEDSPRVIGAIINVNTRIGREEKISMEIAIQTFNKSISNKSNLDLHVLDSGGNPLQASAAANDLVKRYPVEAILGTETWEETVLVAEATKKARVPILSFATPSITPSLTSVRFPFLVRMASNHSQQMRCVASIVGSYGWRRVIAIYEDDGYSTDSRVLSLLSEELQTVGSEIEHSLAFPQFSTLSDPKDFIHKELVTLTSKQSRVFIVVGGSLELVSHIVTEAKDVGFMGSHSVWITTNSVTDLFHSVNSSMMSSMQGIIGIRTHYPMSTPSFLQFSAEFRRKIKSEYPEEDKFEPGICALRAYDTINAMTLALEKSNINSLPTTSTTLLRNILSTNFTGLSGEIQLHNMELSASANYEIVNVVGQSYNVLKYWSPEYGFSDNAIRDMSTQERKNFVGNGSEGWSTNVLGGPVYWPGKLDRTPLGWVMPTDAKPMIIGVPGRTSFDKFVKVKNETNPTPEGFCIDVFKEALKVIGYELPHQFVPFYGLYDDMVDQIYLKNFDAVVGDITILSNRSNYVDFTQPYAESGLKMVVPVKTEEKAWLFVKPFSKKLWLVVGIVFIYTMFVVWFLEHRSNPDFRGSWKNQLSTAMWFTFSTLFFAHRENLRSNYTRLVMFVWLFTVFVVTAGYTASLTSMLTIKRLQPTVTDIQALRTNNAHVGCDGDSFIRKYLERVLHFRKENIINIGSQYDYPDAFKNKTIAAAFLELPYERVFLSTYARDYEDTGLQHRFGGLAFAFPKGSPMARDFSKAFLNLSEEGTLNKLDKKWFSSYSVESNSDDNTGNQSLSLSNFWGLFLVTGLTSTVILLLYIIRLCANFRQRSTRPVDSDESVWKRIGSYYNNDQHHEPNRDQSTRRRRDIEVLISSDGDSLSEYSTPRRHRQPTIEMQENHNGDWDNQTRPLRLFNSFPGPDRRIPDMSNHVSSEWKHIQHSMPL